MKKVRQSYIRRAVLGLLFTFVLFASILSEVGEWYAQNLYPAISKILSALASPFPFSLNEWTVILGMGWVVGYPFYARIRSKKKWLAILGGEVEALLWIYVWFYWGWGMNYYRASFFTRAEVRPAKYDEVQFHQFLDEFTDSLHASFHDYRKDSRFGSLNVLAPLSELPDNSCTLVSEKGRGISTDSIQDGIKALYRLVPAKYGLTMPQTYQHPKHSMFNSLYSNVSVLGFMGPFFAESHMNSELSTLEYPFTYAHELSHLLGVSSEAEANLWAYTICIHSKDDFIRYSGYFGLFTYVWSNARYLLSASDFDRWEASIAPEIMAAFHHTHGYWSMRYNRTLGDMQSALYTFYLKRNRISSGQRNYAQVVGLLLSLPDFRIRL